MYQQDHDLNLFIYHRPNFDKRFGRFRLPILVKLRCFMSRFSWCITDFGRVSCRIIRPMTCISYVPILRGSAIICWVTVFPNRFWPAKSRGLRIRRTVAWVIQHRKSRAAFISVLIYFLSCYFQFASTTK